MEKRIFTVKRLPLLIIPVFITFIATGCSTSNMETVSNQDVNQRADQTFSFYEDENGQNVRWEVNFDGGEISSLYKNGERIPEEEIDDYKDMIYSRLDRLQDESHHITIDMSGFKSDMHRFKEDMQRLKEELKDKDFNIPFDKEEFKSEMKKLSEELSGLKHKKIKIDIDSDKFREEMEKMKKDLDIHINIDMDDLNENLEKMNDEMEKHRDELSHITIDLSGLDEAMSHLDENLGNIKINLDGLDLKLQKLNNFIDRVKNEMVKDNLIKDKDEKINLDLNEDRMKVNGKEVPEELFEKYKKMYEEYFDKKLSDDHHLRIND